MTITFPPQMIHGSFGGLKTEVHANCHKSMKVSKREILSMNIYKVN